MASPGRHSVTAGSGWGKGSRIIGTVVERVAAMLCGVRGDCLCSRTMNNATTDALDILLAHDRWATQQVLEQCRSLSHEQFHRSFDIGPAMRGGLHATLSHTIGAMRRWADRVAERPLRPSIDRPPPGVDRPSDAEDRTVQQLMELLSDASQDLSQIAGALRNGGRLGEFFTVKMPAPGGEQAFRVSRLAAIVHVCDHGTHHRAQCLNILKQLRPQAELVELDVVEWELSVRS